MFIHINLRQATGAVLMSAIVFLASTGAGLLLRPAVQRVSTIAQGRLVPIYKVETDTNRIAFSFDATWGTERTDELLEILDRRGVKTTFFLAGNWVANHPDYVRKIASLGHEIGNHSHAHAHMNRLSPAEIRADLKANHDALTELTGVEPDLFRPPFGEYSNKLIEAANSLGYHTIQWSIDSLDWKDLSAQAMVDRVLARAGPGEIVLFHNAGRHTPEAVDRLLSILAERGLEVVPVGELIYREDAYVESHSGVQKRRRRPPGEEEAAAAAAAGKGGPIFSAPEAGKAVSFAVNVDWGEEHLPAMLEVFERYGAQVTFFLTGSWARRHPELARALREAGHEVANHGLTHAHPKQLSDEGLTRLIIENDRLLREIVGDPSRLFAPPYGEWDARIVQHAASLGFPTVLWTLDTIDWQDPSPETIIGRVAPKISDGAIVLMHPRSNTLAALPAMLEGVAAQGYKVVSVGTLLERERQRRLGEPAE